MTLLETERLVRKISELLQQVGNPEIAPKLAGDYAAVCHAANLRLQQCEAMIKAGDRPQALQLAETVPNLLDLVTVVEFHGSDEWRSHCQQNALPVAERIDARSVQALNECYAHGITTDHPLYAAYRSAVLSRNDEQALKTLQSITRLNPADTNAASELARLDAKVLATKLQLLGGSLELAAPALVVAEIETIEAFGFKSKLDGATWRSAQAVRCGCLLEESGRLRNESRWLEALAKLDFIHRLQDEFKVQLPAAALKELGTLETWARGEQEKDKKERAFQSLLGELHHRIHQSAEKDTSARYVKLPELRDDYEVIHKVWHSLTDFTRPIPEEAASSFRKRSTLLEAEIARRTAIHRRAIFAGSIIVFVVGGVIAWLVVGQMKTRDFTRQLQEAVSQRQVYASDKLLERARSEKIGAANAVAAAETFATKEHALLANFEKVFIKLPAQFTGEPDVARLAGIADQLALAQSALNALAPDLKSENEPRLHAFERQWQTFLSQSSTAVNGLVNEWVSAAEGQCRDLDYRAPLEKTTTQVAALNSLVRRITDAEAGFTNQLQLRNDLLQRAATVRVKTAVYDRELKKLEAGKTALSKARSIKDFSDSIRVLATSEFSVAPAVTAAVAVQSLNANDEATLRILLGVTNAATWAYIKKSQPTRFIPEIAMPAERKIFQQLNSDIAVSGIHQRIRLWIDSEGQNSIDWIIDGLIDPSPGWKKIKAWTASASATGANFEDHDYGYFGGQFKLSPTQPVYRIEKLDSRNETAPFRSVGLEKVQTEGSSYGRPLLEVLDSIKDSREGSPLFRAYLFLELAELMNMQPDAWGLAFCPTAREHAAQIRNIVGAQFSSGDWFVTRQIKANSDKLEKFFADAKTVSYTKQAVGLLALAQAASSEGLQYVGFVGLDGKPNYVDTSAGVEVWGFSTTRKQPVLLAEKIDTDKPLIEKAMPLSPLFALARQGKEYLKKANVSPNDPAFLKILPPLFQAPAQP